MLKIPAIEQIGDVTVYEDDEVAHRFYLVPSTPRIRRDAEGRPILLLSMMRFSEQGRSDNPDLPNGAGYMNFDVELTVTDAEREAVREVLQQRVNDERRGRGPAPAVELAPPTLTDGTVRMYSTQHEAMVEGQLAEVDASTVAGSAAVFNMSLSAEGANFMYGLFVNEGGEGNIDLSPLQIVYDLKMRAKLPPVGITVTSETTRVQETLVTAAESSRTNRCTGAEIDKRRGNGINSSTLYQSGEVKMEIVNDAGLDAEALEPLQDFAFDMFDSMVTDVFFEPAPMDDDDVAIENPDPTMSAASGVPTTLYSEPGFQGQSREVHGSAANLGLFTARSVKVSPGQRVTLYSGKNYASQSRILTDSSSTLPTFLVRSIKIKKPKEKHYILKHELNEASTDIRVEVDQAQVVEWPTGGQATLEATFAGMSETEIARHVVEITEDRFETLAVDVRGIADFENTPVAAIEVQLEYIVDGELKSTNAFTFNREDIAAALFDPAILDDVREYRFRYKITYDDGIETEYTEWETTTRRDLNIPAIDPGHLAVDVSGASLNWSILNAVIVSFSYTHPGGELEAAAHTSELNEVTPADRWEHRINVPLEGDAEARLSYRLKDDKVIEAEPIRFSASDNLFVVPPPQVDTLDVMVVPAGDFTDVLQVVVSLRYEAGEGIVYDETFKFTAADESARWQVLLRDPNQRTYTYEYLVTYKSGSPRQFPPQTHTGDGALLLEVPSEPRLKATLNGALLDFDETPTVVVKARYGDEEQTFVVTADATVHTFSPALTVDGAREWSYEATYNTENHGELSSGVVRTSDRTALIPRPSLPRAGSLEVIVRGFGVDFAATPVVDVNLRWADGDRVETELVTLTADANSGNWTLEIGDASQRRYSYEVIYSLPDGTRVPGPSGQTEDPVVSVTAYQP